MKLYIKYMVSQRCKLMVKEVLKKLDIKYAFVDLGVVDIFEDLNAAQLNLLKTNLMKSGLELISNKRSIIIESIKNAIIQMVHYSENLPKENYSDYISKKLGYDYTYLANVFSEDEGVTIQLFIILNKIEKVKELLLYDELSLTEIATRLHYSSVSHLSNQFKKVTGLTPSFYKGIAIKRRVNLEDV